MIIKVIKDFFEDIKYLFKDIICFLDKRVIDITKKPIPCVDCGACCSYFKVFFNNNGNETVPKNKIIPINIHQSIMLGTEKKGNKCNSLTGSIGKNSLCSIYENRPSVCRSFSVWLNNGRQNPKCIRARIYNGLPGKIE